MTADIKVDNQSPPAAPGSRKEAAQQTRQRILEAAMDIIGEQGYAAMTSTKLINQAGIAKGTLYHHFDSIDAVVVALLEMLINDYMESVPADNHDNLLDYLYDLGEFTLDMIERDNRMLNTLIGLLPLSLREEKFRLLNQKLIEQACLQLAPAFKRFLGDDLPQEKINDAIRITDCFGIGLSVHQAIFQDRAYYSGLWRKMSQVIVLMLER